MIGTDTARALWHVAPGRAELRTTPLQQPGTDEVLVRARFGAISRGTERLVACGEVPESEHERMRAPFQRGDFPFPVLYGYIGVGTVERGPADLVGHDVFCLHPHQDRYTVPLAAVTPLPPDVPPERAVLAANLETAINALWDAGPRIGDRVAVVGAGAVGCLVAWLAARLPGTRVQLIDVDGARAATAAALGCDFARPADALGDCDLVVHASGQGAGLTTALALAGFEATVLELSWYGTREVVAPLGGAFHSQRLTLKSSQVGHVAASRRARRGYADRLGLALAELADPALDVLLDRESAFEDLPAAMAALAAGSDRSLCHRIRY